MGCLLLLWPNNKLVYPPELSRIAGFCTNSNKNFLGRTQDPPFKQNCLSLYYNHNTANHLKKFLKKHTQIPPIFLANSRSNGLCMSYLKSPLLIFFFANRCLKPWKLLENVPQKSLKSPWKRCVMIYGNHDFDSDGYFLDIIIIISDIDNQVSVNNRKCLARR